MVAVIHLFYEWFKNRSWFTWFTQWYEYHWRILFKNVANGDVEQSKKLIQLMLIIYGLIELGIGSFIIKLLGDSFPHLILFPASVFIFGIITFLPKEIFIKNDKWLNRSLSKIVGWSLCIVFVIASPYLLESEYFQRNNIPFNFQVWNIISFWIGGFLITLISILLIGKLFNLLHFRFSNLLTKGLQKFANHCLNTNKEMPLAAFIIEVSLATFAIATLFVIIRLLFNYFK